MMDVRDHLKKLNDLQVSDFPRLSQQMDRVKSTLNTIMSDQKKQEFYFDKVVPIKNFYSMCNMMH